MLAERFCSPNSSVMTAEGHEGSLICGESFVMFKGRHFDQSVILLCVRWYLAYNLSLRDLEEMMAERGLSVDHSTVASLGHPLRAAVAGALQPAQACRHRQVGTWDETYIKVRVNGCYLYPGHRQRR